MIMKKTVIAITRAPLGRACPFFATGQALRFAAAKPRLARTPRLIREDTRMIRVRFAFFAVPAMFGLALGAASLAQAAEDNVLSSAATTAGDVGQGAGHVASDAAVGAGNVAGEVAGPIPRKAGEVAGDAADAAGHIAKKTLDLTSDILRSIF